MREVEKYYIKIGNRYIFRRCYGVFDEELAREFSSYSSARKYANKYFKRGEYIIVSRKSADEPAQIIDC